jgi:hypothetical protein
MAIPDNITIAHIDAAIQHILAHGVPSEHTSKKFNLVYIDQAGREFRLPPKFVIMVANRYANGVDLAHTELSGGWWGPPGSHYYANTFLHGLGYTIVPPP